LLAVLLAGCPKEGPEGNERVTLKRTGDATFELIPGTGQPEYCLVYTVASNGLLRQLTMSAKNQSFDCKPGQPVGARQYRVPLSDGAVKVLVLFTSEPVHAGSVSQQLLEAQDPTKLSVLNLRLPGNATLATLDFEPHEETPVAVGSILGMDAGSAAAGQDGGATAGDTGADAGAAAEDAGTEPAASDAGN